MVKLSIIGSGYVGLVTGVCFASLGHNVVFVDIDQKKVDKINSSVPPIFEEGLEELMQRFSDRIMATTDYSYAVGNSECTFICVGTPSQPDGSLDTRYIESAGLSLGRALAVKTGPHGVIMKSTVLPGTTETILAPIIERESGKTVHGDIGLGCNPEFLKEGVAVDDFTHPDRVVLGCGDAIAEKILDELYGSFECPKVKTTIQTAEMIKYVSNAFLATKISFANEIGNLCKQLGIDTREVFYGVGLDSRINPSFFGAGVGFGGSCFPKDVRALVACERKNGLDPQILDAVLSVNENQPERLIDLLVKHLPGLQGKTIGILGLAFKSNTDDIRESRAIPVIQALMDTGCRIIAYDPMAAENMRELFPQVDYRAHAYEVVSQADAVLIMVDEAEFEDLDYSGSIVIDGRGVRRAAVDAQLYEGICW